MGTASGRADGLEHTGVQCLDRRLGPAQQEAESRVEPVGRFYRSIDHGRCLSQGRSLTVRQRQGVAENNLAVLGPDLEMPEPDPLIDQGYQLMQGRTLGLGGPQVDGTANLQAVALGAPCEPQFIVLPGPGDGKGQVSVANPIKTAGFRRPERVPRYPEDRAELRIPQPLTLSCSILSGDSVAAVKL
jgi:hypothetical protein